MPCGHMRWIVGGGGFLIGVVLSLDHSAQRDALTSLGSRDAKCRSKRVRSSFWTRAWILIRSGHAQPTPFRNYSPTIKANQIN